MKYKKLGISDLKVSRVCLGCMGFGNAKTGQHSWTVDEESSRAIINYNSRADFLTTILSLIFLVSSDSLVIRKILITFCLTISYSL